MSEIISEIEVIVGDIATAEVEAQLACAKGDKGDPGKSAYQSAVDGGYQGTEQEFNLILATAQTQINGKVDKVQGKGLSTEDYTTEEKNKLAGLINDTTASATTTYSSNKIESIVGYIETLLASI